MASDGKDSTSARFFDALNHPLRVRILNLLEQSPMSFSDLKKQVHIESSGHLAFHLEKLSPLVRIGVEGRYELTDDGHEAILLMKSMKHNGSEHPIPTTRRRLDLRRATPKIALALGVLVILVLASLFVVLYDPYYGSAPGGKLGLGFTMVSLSTNPGGATNFIIGVKNTGGIAYSNLTIFLGTWKAFWSYGSMGPGGVFNFTQTFSTPRLYPGQQYSITAVGTTAAGSSFRFGGNVTDTAS